MSGSIQIHVIDDDDSVRESLSFLLECAEFSVRAWPSADAFLNTQPPLEGCVIITDIRMPGLNGVELTAQLRQTGSSVPVIVITGHADVPLAINAMKAGVADFIEKPFEDSAILSAVRDALARQDARGSLEIERETILSRLASLSQREREVLDGLVDGQANKAIAYDLQISARTVEVYRANLMTKMNAQTLSDLVKMVMIAKLAPSVNP